MDIITLRSLVTVVSMLLFVGIVLWAWRHSRAPAFDAAAALPFSGDALTEDPGVQA